MLTFEDFFKKKKIDLQQLQQAEPAVYAEFNREYPLMGEKSFDHSKKYWFNNLRRTYPLPEIVKPHPVLAEAISDIAVQGIAVAAAQNLDTGIEKPKFKEDELVALSAPDIAEKDISLAEAEQDILQSQQGTTVIKPAFKPRFNSKNLPKTKNQLEKETTEASPKPDQPESETTKPAFKPRFNMQNIKKDTIKTVSEPVVPNVETILDRTGADTSTAPEEILPKPAYVPRFNFKNLPKPIDRQTQEESASTENEQQPEIKPDKPTYKPRFQMKNPNNPTQPD